MIISNYIILNYTHEQYNHEQWLYTIQVIKNFFRLRKTTDIQITIAVAYNILSLMPKMNPNNPFWNVEIIAL